MKVWYLGHTSIKENHSDFGLCATCSFGILCVECYDNPLFDVLHSCCSIGKHYREITKSDIFNL